MNKEKKLYRIDEGKMIAGVCGGLGEYFGIDSNIVRLGWFILSLVAGYGIFAYIIAIIIMPRKIE